ncbi:hypothetical protein HZ993_12730 [Rhodoferax sp. AJA081-3]|uniref:hypothetical protein n=1 Tax=Rhodoferax sp. AJA081-3 TaxID=2752316 RepID=UPI001ADECCC2|nr:hypothetical protein [Rhodoferax sp. AJA081-3]QTN26210.1 hypothetical protein HZ993_12730 [Rhodoferax sp. AJA081-3]
MSYYTRLELSWDDGDYAAGDMTPEAVLLAARPFVVASDWGVEDVLSDLRESAEGNGLDRQGYNRIVAFDLIELIATVSRAYPDVTFYARGVGEEYFDTWARHFRGGAVLWEFGPFDPD